MDSEIWKTATAFLVGALSTAVPAIWSITRRPTFTQVDGLLAKHEASSCYSKDRRAIEARFDVQDEKLEALGRHTLDIQEKVEKIFIDFEAQRQLRAQKAIEGLKRSS